MRLRTKALKETIPCPTRTDPDFYGVHASGTMPRISCTFVIFVNTAISTTLYIMNPEKLFSLSPWCR
jgi:hypothetical protein